ncbi:MAG: dicarboxylate/amino acid:cation symporter [Pseudomonadales bacterium]
MNLTTRILTGMGLGLLLGLLINWLDQASFMPASLMDWIQWALIDGVLDVVGKIFIASLKLLVVPLVFVSLVCGCSSLGGNSRMGGMAIRTLALYMLTTAAAITLALLTANLLNPGIGMDMVSTAVFDPASRPPLKEVIIDIFPTNPIQAMAEGNMLQIIVFSILMGVAISRCGETGKKVQQLFEQLNEVIMKMVVILMHLAPYGVFCMLTKLFATVGYSAIADLALYFFTVVLVLVLHALGFYSLLLSLLTRLSPLAFFSNIRPAMLFAFSTSSSNATLPVTLNVAKKRLGVDNSVASFTLPLGATINMDGTAIMQGVATVFIAQAFNIDIGLTGYLLVILTATLASVGTAGVPGVGMITLAMVLQQVGLPVEGIALIIGVDRLLDMMRTAVNVAGDSMVSTIIAHNEKLLNRELFNDLSDQDEYQPAANTEQPKTS